MRFYFDIDDEDFTQEDGLDFKEYIRSAVIHEIADRIIYDEIHEGYWAETRLAVKEILKQHTKEIVDNVIEKVSDKIAAKKSIVSLTPKASELAAVDKDNVEYFEKMIDKAIAKRFGA